MNPDGMPKGESNMFLYDTSRGNWETAHDAQLRRLTASVGIQARVASRTVADGS